jgi:hypothetical protein
MQAEINSENIDTAFLENDLFNKGFTQKLPSHLSARRLR